MLIFSNIFVLSAVSKRRGLALRACPEQRDMSQQPWLGVGEGMFLINFRWICAAGLSEPLPHPKKVYSVANHSSHLKDVRANCLCASLLRTQFMSQRHATSCTSAHKEEIYSHKGMVSVALTSLRFNSLGWSVTPTFLWIDDFLY